MFARHPCRLTAHRLSRKERTKRGRAVAVRPPPARTRAMPDLTMSIPHRLTRDEAQRRIRAELRQFQQQSAGMVQTVEERWDGYTLHLTVAAVGQTITGQARVEEQT